MFCGRAERGETGMGETLYQRHWGMPEGRIRDVVNQLEEQNEVKFGDAILVRIPKIEGRIYTRQEGPHLIYVMYIYETRWDREKKQTRNRKVMIGQAIESIPGAMLPNENYYRFFDRRTGQLIEVGAGAGPDTGDSSGVRLDTSPDAQNRPRVRSRETGKLTEETGSVPRGQSSRYATGAYRADYPLGTPEPALPGTSEEEEEKTMTERQEMIRNVMEEEGMIGRDSERVREELRGIRDDRCTGGTVPPVYREGTPAKPSPRYTRTVPLSAKKTRILLDLLTSMRDVVREHARKRPEDVVPLYQVEKINPVLEEIRKMETELGYGEMLEVLSRPRTRIVDGEQVTEGMSYGDAEVLLECYNSVIWFTRDELIGKPGNRE